MQVVPKQNARDETKIDVEVMVKERPMKTADLQLEWSLAKGESGKPMLVTPLPGKRWRLVPKLEKRDGPLTHFQIDMLHDPWTQMQRRLKYFKYCQTRDGAASKEMGQAEPHEADRSSDLAQNNNRTNALTRKGHKYLVRSPL